MVVKSNFQTLPLYYLIIPRFFLIVKQIFSAHFTQKIILDYQMFIIAQHGKTIVKGRNTFNNAITVTYVLTFILKDPVEGPKFVFSSNYA